MAATETETLSPSDLSAIQAEQGNVMMHVGGVLVFDAPIERDAIVRRARERIHLIPRYRMRLDERYGGMTRPVWVDDERFDVDRHVRRLALPAPGGDTELCELVGWLMSVSLERDRPLWEMTVVEGLEGGRGAVIFKVHHALVDGVAAVNVAMLILDPTPEPLEIPPPEEVPDEGTSPRMEQLARLATDQLRLPRKLALRTMSRARTFDPRQATQRARKAAETMGELAKVREQAPETRLNTEIGRDRLFALARGRLDEVKAVRHATGATVNDVLLTAVSLMLTEYLGGPNSPERAVALVPVSVRREGAEDSASGNMISTVFCDLPLRGEPLERLEAIHEEMEEIKDSAQIRAGALMVGATGMAPPVVSSLAVRAMSGPRLFNLVVSNVPGPQQTFYLDGVALREVFPAAPLNPSAQALTIGILSYDGGVYFGLLTDRDALPDVADAAVGLERALASLLEAAS